MRPTSGSGHARLALPHPKPPARTKHALTAALIILLLLASARQTDASLGELARGLPNMMELLREMIPPRWSYLGHIIPGMLETIRMALLGTTLGALAAIPVAIMCAANLMPYRGVHIPARFLLNLIRTLPDLLLAALFVAIFGLGPVPGIFALAVFSLGLIAKLAYETLETIDRGPLEAMTAVGMNRVQLIAFGVVPQVAAQFMSYVLYAFEVNVRAAAILGLVGAGGIGLYYEATLGFLEYDKTSAIILFTLAIVLVIDYASTKLREKLL